MKLKDVSKFIDKSLLSDNSQKVRKLSRKQRNFKRVINGHLNSNAKFITEYHNGNLVGGSNGNV